MGRAVSIDRPLTLPREGQGLENALTGSFQTLPLDPAVPTRHPGHFDLSESTPRAQWKPSSNNSSTAW